MSSKSVTIGRVTTNDIVLGERVVSGRHARLDRLEGVLHITDLSSLNGTLINGSKIKPGEPHPVKVGDVLSIGNFTLTLHSASADSAVPKTALETINIAPPKLETPKEETPQIPDLRGRTSLTIGRGPDNDVHIDHPTVSRKHARIIQGGRDGVYSIEDLGSTNGTFVNGERVVQTRVLKLDDIIHIGPYKLTYRPEQIKAVDESRYLRLDALNLKKFVGKGKNLLQDISLCIKPREFVAIVGMAGSGKTTLLDALNGFRPASEGRVLVNGEDLYTNFDAYRNQLGYVPQKNIVHMGLTAYEVLDYSARLRLPADTTQAERHKRVTDVLDTLGIIHCKDRPVSTLSGGEQRRVAMGVELLARPGLFFLDEVTSGLDPGTERQIMRLLRTISRQGQTIFLITHATKNVMECDMVVFLAKGGYLAYYGPPQEALSYFGVKEFDDIYDKLQGERSPEEWGERYLQSEQYDRYIKERARHKSNAAKASSARSFARPGAGDKRVSSLSQFLILSRRNLNILMRDKASLILMLLTPLIVGLLDFLFWKSGIFESSGGDAMRAITTLNITAVICFLVGGLASMREIVKESDIYRRERMVAIKIVPYVLSKAWIAVIISLYSAGVFILFMKLAGNWPPFDQMGAIYLTMFLAILAGMMTGLFISALSPNQNVTPLLLVLFLVPQIIFGGMLPARYFGDAGSALGKLTTTKWAFESMVTVSEMGECVADPSCNQENCMRTNVLTQCDFPGIRQSPTADDAQKSIVNMKENYGDAFSVNLAAHWGVLAAFIVGLFVMVVGVLRWKDKR